MELFTAQHDGGDEIQQIQQKVKNHLQKFTIKVVYETMDRMIS